MGPKVLRIVDRKGRSAGGGPRALTGSQTRMGGNAMRKWALGALIAAMSLGAFAQAGTGYFAVLPGWHTSRLDKKRP